MIVALSRFKVANGMEEFVARAFLNRPRLVENAEGFLGLEVFTDRSDATVFYLSTRWTSESAFRQWHSSEAHHASHQGIPKGLKLDAAVTQLTVLDYLCG
jgi:heme-degrading monooxygenase HmoA